jgi:hypothetical protein
MRTLITGIIIQVFLLGLLAGCSYSTRFQVGEYGAAHTASITKHYP